MSGTEAELSPLKRALVEIRELRARIAAAERAPREPVAIVGIGLRFPGGATDPGSFWRLLADGVDAIGEVPTDRWDADALHSTDPDEPGRMVTRGGGFLDDIDRFDADFFGISAREAESMDPQQRLLLEVAWEALEHAGIPPDALFGSATGVYLGISNSDYMRLLLADPLGIDTYTTTGNALSIAAGRLAYVLGTRGPAVAVDTACSSSLVALHDAVRSLRSGESDLALAGGVNLILTPELTINFSRARMMAPDGRCKTFDAAADGYVRSEGCALVVLKRLRDAEADGDRVLAVVRGSAVNQDGRSGGITAPNGPAQEEVVATALADAGAEPLEVAYVEAHGTGTLLGDPIEAQALGAVLGADRPADAPLLVGSVKTNIGHTEAAAGVAGLIKAVLVLQHAAVPPNLHLHRLNPHIADAGLALEVPTALTPLPGRPGARLVGVSSFGLSGTNAHVVLGEAPPTPSVPSDDLVGARVRVLPLSARSDAALAELAARYADLLEQAPDVALADVAAAAGATRSHLPRRLGVVAVDRSATIAALRTVAGGATVSSGAATARTPVDPVAGETAFLFTGHGAHLPGAGRDLYAAEPVFRAAIDECASLLAGTLDVDLTEALFGDGALLGDMTYAQPALFALQHGLASLWGSWGVVPAVVAGHSGGEYAAAAFAGVMPLPDALRVVAARGRLLASVRAPGRMAALFADEASVAAAVARRAGDVGIAAVNGPFTTVVSGRPEAVAAVITDLGLDDDEVRHLDISVAAHSPLVEPVLGQLAAEVATVPLSQPSIGLVSSMTGRFATAELVDPAYWRAHTRAPVRFAEVFDTLRAVGCRTFVEIGPGTTLLDLGRRAWPDAEGTWVPSLRPGAPEVADLAVGLATVYATGGRVDWSALGDADARLRRDLDLPTYPWQRASYWAPAARACAPAGVPLFDAASRRAAAQATQGPLDLHVERYPTLWDLADRAATASIVAALRDVGLFASDGEARSIDELFGPGAFDDAHRHLVARWLDHLVADGLLERRGSMVVSPRALPEADRAGAFAALQVAGAGVEPFVDYVTRCGEQLTAVVTGRESALATLFPDGSYETVDFNYGAWAVARYFNAIVRAAVEGALDARAGRRLRVLEVGAGTGGTTAAVLPGLPADRISYTFTDVSSFFLVRASERFAEYPFVRYVELDLDTDPANQGFAPGSFDVVIAANVLHATRDLDRTLAHVRRLLAPGGVLVALESTSHPRFYDVTTGLIEGWERFDDEWRVDVPLLDPPTWRAALERADFSITAVEPGGDAPTGTLLQHVLLARASGGEVDAVAHDRPDLADLASDRESAPSPLAVLDAVALLDDALPDERHDVMVTVVRRAVAHVLRSRDDSRLGRTEPLLDLGFDSLMAVELRNVLREALQLRRKLPATLVFDHPTIDAIATYLESLAATHPNPDTDADDAVEPTPPTGSVPAEPLAVDAAAAMTDEEAEALLLARLGEIEP